MDGEKSMLVGRLVSYLLAEVCVGVCVCVCVCLLVPGHETEEAEAIKKKIAAKIDSSGWIRTEEDPR